MLFLHIGMPKTDTTSIRETLAGLRSKLSKCSVNWCLIVCGIFFSQWPLAANFPDEQKAKGIGVNKIDLAAQYLGSGQRRDG